MQFNSTLANFFFLRLENTLPLVVGVNVLQQLRCWFSQPRWRSNFISINGIFQPSQMNICISHNGLGKKSQNVILWKRSHCLFFINTVILIEIQLPHFPAEKATHFWNTFFLVLKNKQQTSEQKSYYFHFFVWTNILAYCALRKGMKDRVLWLRCSWGPFWTSVIKLLVIVEDRSQSSSPQFQG